MRSARMILATAAASTVLALGAPGAWAASGGDWDQSDSSYSKEQDKEQGKEHGKGSDHDRPHGGMHTGGGALTAVNADDWGTAKDPKMDPETYKDKDEQGGKDSGGWSGKQEEDGGWSGSHEKPSGGMHTGGGALASPGMTAGGLAVLAVAGTGLYAARRKKTAGSLA
ncbi:hypothetical protein [Streptomyces sp. 351MFTsu5.1]|uniref:hypothetical protein n=1 Tax=Streptomyces sp. 351MFTsu5.1 TaxID=1172180 RepID=UPI0003AABDB9|nr:hypothetical protein [Streptomyces sp. 351MFTsu5.1]